jgi:hypothetical protein
VNELVLRTLDAVDGRFTRADVRACLVDAKVPDDELEAMAMAVVRTPGVLDNNDGTYRLHQEYRLFAAHRDWRITPRRLDVCDVWHLLYILEQHPTFTDNLASMRNALRGALDGLKGE